MCHESCACKNTANQGIVYFRSIDKTDEDIMKQLHPITLGEIYRFYSSNPNTLPPVSEEDE